MNNTTACPCTEKDCFQRFANCTHVVNLMPNHWLLFIVFWHAPLFNSHFSLLHMIKMHRLEVLSCTFSERCRLHWPASRVDSLWHCLFEGLMKRSSAPLRMAWELVSGLPVSTQPGWGHLMYWTRMGTDGRKGRDGWKRERKKEEKSRWR